MAGQLLASTSSVGWKGQETWMGGNHLCYCPPPSMDVLVMDPPGSSHSAALDHMSSVCSAHLGWGEDYIHPSCQLYLSH